MINHNRELNCYVDEETGMSNEYKIQLMADIKRQQLKLPNHHYLSNRFVLNNLVQ